MGFQGQRSAVITVTPTITAQAYTAGKQLGTATKIPGAVSASGAGATLMSLAIMDKANQKSAIDVLIFNASPTTVADGSTFDITDAELVAKYQCRVVVPNTNYKTNGASSNADVSVGNIWQKVKASAGNVDLWCVLVCQGTPTYTSTSDIVLTFGFDQD